MKSYELQPTHENLLQTFQRNAIDRNKDICRFVELLNCIDDSCAIALDGRWGSGKTFFVKQAKMILDSLNKTIVENQSEADLIHSCLKNYMEPDEIQPHVSVYYDAWSNDNDVDPVLSLVYEIMQNVDSNYDLKETPDFFNIASSIAEIITGRNVKALFESFQREDTLASLKHKKDIHKQIEEFLESILYERGNRLVVFIDELDRCKPSYAVQLLERIKHYFSCGRITFVFSINSEELQHTISRYYGEKFDSCRYLDRFFDLHVSLPPADMDKYYQMIGFENGGWIYEQVCKVVIRVYDFQLREISKFYRMAKIAASEVNHSNCIGFSIRNGLSFGLMYILPVMIALKMSDSTKYYLFIQGKLSAPLIDVLTDDEIAEMVCRKVLREENTEKMDEISMLKDRISKIYEAIFIQDYSQMFDVRVGEFRFDRQTKEDLMRTVSLLSNFSTFE